MGASAGFEVFADNIEIRVQLVRYLLFQAGGPNEEI